MPETTVTFAPGTPCWVDLGSPDLDVSKKFYGAVFGWDAETSPDPQYGGYTLFTLHGKKVCAVSPLMAPEQPSTWNSYVAVEDAKATAARATAAGGTVVLEPMDVPGQGWMAGLQDPTGAYIFLWQPTGMPGAEWVNGVGGWCWNELNTRDTTAPVDFYQAIFNWEPKVATGPMPYTEWLLNGRTIGGMMPMPEGVPAEVPSNWMVYFTVSDVDETCAKITANGGAIRMPRMDTPQGPMAVVADPHGAVFSIIALKG